MKNKSLYSYGCSKCQKIHYENEKIYNEHINSQSKHGISRTEKQ